MLDGVTRERDVRTVLDDDVGSLLDGKSDKSALGLAGRCLH